MFFFRCVGQYRTDIILDKLGKIFDYFCGTHSGSHPAQNVVHRNP